MRSIMLTASGALLGSVAGAQACPGSIEDE